MTKFLAVKHFSSLRPAGVDGEELLHKIKQGELVQIEVTRPRNVKFHRKFFALLNLVWGQLDHDKYPSLEDLLARVKIIVGLRTLIEFDDGSTGYIPGSIAFAKMDETEFSVFYDKVVDLITRKFLPGVTSDELRHEVEMILDANY